MSEPAESLFCNECQHNQALVQKLVAEYLPDDDDPEYEEYEAAFDEYRVELEDRYPQVCKKCEDRVNDQILKTGYAARADHLRRIMEKSEQKKRAVHTSRQALTLRIISLAKWTFLLSSFVQAVWHMLGFMMAPDERVWEDGDTPSVLQSTWDACARQAFYHREVDECCVISPYVTNIVSYALIAEALTIWWNPRLKDKTNSITGRMRGLKTLWAIRVAVVGLRVFSLYYWPRSTVNRENLTFFHYTHLSMLFFTAFSCLATWKFVRITYQSPASFRSSVDAHSASAPTSPEKSRKKSYKPAHPNPTQFDLMGHDFASGLDDDSGSAAFPPSPTLTNASYTTHATEATTPFGRKTHRDIDDMDWEPATRFGVTKPTVHPSPFARHDPTPTPRQPHSIFTERDPNPFHHKVPAAPKAPAHAKAAPWKAGIWAPPVQGTTQNFFRDDHNARNGGGVGEMTGLDGLGVPKNVKRDAELFASPKLKYDYYGTMRDTGLEDRFEETFNSLFAK